MCHPKAYWKVSLFRTTTGEKFEIRYINVVRVESSGFWSYIHTQDGGGKKVYPITYFFGVAASMSASVFSNFQPSWQCIFPFRIQINFFFQVPIYWNLPFWIWWLIYGLVHVAVVAEWLRRWTWNPMEFLRAGSNPADCVKLTQVALIHLSYSF